MSGKVIEKKKKVIIAVLFRHKETTGLWIFKRILVHAQLKS